MTTIKFKTGLGVSTPPGSLAVGEPALNPQASGSVQAYVGKSSGAVARVGYSGKSVAFLSTVPANGALGTFSEGAAFSASAGAISAIASRTVTHTVVSGSLPPNVELNATTGALTAPGNLPLLQATAAYNFTIQATDGVDTITRSFSMTISATNTAPAWVTASGSIGLMSAETPSFSYQLQATDNEVGANLTFSLASGALPPGFTLSSSGLVSGNHPGTEGVYSFSVNVSDGITSSSRSFSITINVAYGEAVYTTPGTYTFTVPTNCTSISAVAVGGGGGGGGGNPGFASSMYGGGAGGGCCYLSIYPVTPGEQFQVVVGAGGLGLVNPGAYAPGNGGNGEESSLLNISTSQYLLRAYGGGGGTTTASSTGGSRSGGDGGGAGGAGGAGGGGAAGYSGAGGAGGAYNLSGNPADTSSGGAGGGGGGNSSREAAAGGGGVGLFGKGTTGAGSGSTVGGGSAGSGGSAGKSVTGDSQAGAGGNYGGGGGRVTSNSSGRWAGDGASGAVRIIWGPSRSFPSNAA